MVNKTNSETLAHFNATKRFTTKALYSLSLVEIFSNKASLFSVSQIKIL
jgi:hypothetical protein